MQSSAILLLSIVMTKVEKAILRTLAFFDIFQRPLFLDEIWHFLYQVKASRLQVLIGLKNLQKKKLIIKKEKYFFLSGSQKNLADFKRKQQICQKRWQKVNWVIKVLKYVPFVKNISVINSLSFGVSDENSDIDILIIARKDRLWTARALTVILLEILGQNKNKWYQANKFCLGFAFDENNLALDRLRLNPPAGGDIYFTFWLAQLVSCFDQKIYQRFIHKENYWLRQDLPNWEMGNPPKTNLKPSFLERLLNRPLGGKMENWLAKIQIKRILADPQSKKGSVLADLHLMKLHHADRRLDYQRKWQKKLEVMGINS